MRPNCVALDFFMLQIACFNKVIKEVGDFLFLFQIYARVYNSESKMEKETRSERTIFYARLLFSCDCKTDD